MKPYKIADGKKRSKPWVVRVNTGIRNSSGRYIYKQCLGATATEAKEEAKNILTSTNNFQKKSFTNNKHTLFDASQELVKDWETAERERLQNPKKGLSPDTVDRNKSWLKSVFKFVNQDILLQSIDKQFVRGLIRDLKIADISDSKRTRIWRFFNQILESAVISDFIDSNPAALQKFKEMAPSYHVEKKRSIDLSVMKKVVHYLFDLQKNGLDQEGEAALIFIIQANTGCRWGEVAALNVSDIDFANNFIRVNKSRSTKTNFISLTKSAQLRQDHGDYGERIVPFAKGLEPILRHHISYRKNQLFSVSYSYCSEIIIKIRKKFNLDYLDCKSFRKFVSTQYRALGADVKDTQALLGHKDEETQDEYITYQVNNKFAEGIWDKLN
jgi:integrase